MKTRRKRLIGPENQGCNTVALCPPARCRRFDSGCSGPVWINSPETREQEGSGLGGTVAAVSDRPEAPSMCALQAGVKYLSGL